MPAVWSIECDSSKFIPVGELTNVNNFKVDVALSKVRTFQMKIRLDNPYAEFLAVTSGLEPIYIKAKRNGILLFNGPLMTLQETGEDNNAFVTVNAAGPESIFAKRLVATKSTEQIPGISFAAGTPMVTRFVELLAASNARAVGAVTSAGETHIDYTTGPITCTAKNAYISQSFRTLSEVLTDMYNQAEGFDWYVQPQEANSSKIGRLIMQDIIGALQSNAAFEWGGGLNNVAKYNRTVDVTNLISEAWNISSAGPEATGSPTVQKISEEAAAKWGLMEAMVPLSALNITLREAIALEALNYRKKPRQVVTFEPSTDDGTGRVPQFEKDFGLGDSVPLRIVYNKVQHLYAAMRCWGASFAVDENGKETQTILTSEE